MRYLSWSLLAASAVSSCGAPVATAAGQLVLTVDGRSEHPAASTEIWLRDAEQTEFGFLGRDGARLYGNLDPGTYEVAARIPFAVGGPWIYASRACSVRPGESTEVRLDPGAGRTARFAFRPGKDTPPFFLVLANEGTAFPTRIEQLGQRFSQERFPDDLCLALQSDGRSGLDAIPALEPGTYQLFQIANDWETGDPSPLGRTLAITLEDGKTTVLHLEDKLQRMSTSIE